MGYGSNKERTIEKGKPMTAHELTERIMKLPADKFLVIADTLGEHRVNEWAELLEEVPDLLPQAKEAM